MEKVSIILKTFIVALMLTAGATIGVFSTTTEARNVEDPCGTCDYWSDGEHEIHFCNFNFYGDCGGNNGGPCGGVPCSN